MTRALLRFADATDRLTTRVGQAAAWLYPLLVCVLLVNVALRYGLGIGSIRLEELQWHLYSAAFLLGLAYTYAADEHVRVDLLRERLPPRARAAIELAGSLLLLLPFCAIVARYAFDFFLRSVELGERSAMPSGLPARWVIKGVLFAALVLLGLQALSVAARSAARLARPAGGAGSGPARGSPATDPIPPIRDPQRPAAGTTSPPLS